MADGDAHQYHAIPMDFSFAAAADGVWQDSAHQGLEERDLRLAEASHGQMRAVELKAEAPGVLQGWSRPASCNFLFLYVLRGDIAFSMADGSEIRLSPRHVTHLPLLAAVDRARFSADFEAVEVVAPGREGLDHIEPLLRIAPKPADGDWEALVWRDPPEAYIRGDGPRAFFTYRDLGAAAQTERRIQIHDGDGAQAPMAGGTGWHDHSMSQFFIVLDGEAVLEVDGHGVRRMGKGDAMTLSAGLRHNVSAYSVGYNVIEICLPADYDTTGRPAP